MIEITLKESETSFYIKAEGHSGVTGQSIVCASVSVLVETWRLSEEILEQESVKIDKGILEGSVPKTEIAKILFTQLGIGLKAIQQQYPEEITLNIGG